MPSTPWVPPLQPWRIKPTVHAAKVFQLFRTFPAPSNLQLMGWSLESQGIQAKGQLDGGKTKPMSPAELSSALLPPQVHISLQRWFLPTVFSPGVGQVGVLKARREGGCLEILLGGEPVALWDLQGWKPEPYLQHTRKLAVSAGTTQISWCCEKEQPVSSWEKIPGLGTPWLLEYGTERTRALV